MNTSIVFKYEPTNKKRILITQATSKGSDEPVHKGSLTRAFAIQKGIGDCTCAFEESQTGKP